MDVQFKHFRYSDADCPCCGKNFEDIKVFKLLDQLRDDFGGPITIVSGYRCEAHNKAVGGVSGSQHTLGKAADVTCSDLDRLYELAPKYFEAIGDGRSKGFLHLDLRTGKIRRWVY